MNKRIYTLALTLLATPVVSHGDSMIGNFINRLGNSKDISRHNPGVTRVGNGPFYMYKLNSRNSTSAKNNTPVEKTPPKLEYDLVAIENALREQAERADAIPERNVINAHKKSMETAQVMEDAEKQTLYVDDDSPLKNPSVKAAWDRAREAEKRLEAHRDYMERVRKSRMRVSEAKRTPSVDSSKVSND